MAGVTHRLEAHVLGEGDWIGATEICRLCWLDLGAVMELAELGVVAPRGTPPGEWQIPATALPRLRVIGDRKSTRLNSSHSQISYAVFCLKKKKNKSKSSPSPTVTNSRLLRSTPPWTTP